MTLAKITAGDGYTYLTRHTAHADADGGKKDATAYYTAQGNPPGRWTGRGAPLLGLAEKEVTEDHMRALFGHGAPPDEHAMIRAYIHAHDRPGMSEKSRRRLEEEAVRHATLGRQFPHYRQLEPFDHRVAQRLDMIRNDTRREPTATEIKKVKADEARRQRAAVAGFDLVFTPVKSATLLWALDDRAQVRDAIRDAHEEAVNAALALLEEHAAYTRTGTDGVAQIATNGLIAAAFEHWDSRAGDPNLHTHVAISAKVQGVDGKWRALDARPLYRMGVTASETYNTAFEAAMTARLGVTFTARPDTTGGREPIREITRVPFAMVEFFSRRRAAIEARYAQLTRAYRDQHGHDPDTRAHHHLAQRANLDTRQGKKPPVPLADKRAAWRDELTTRFGHDAVAQLMKAVPSSPPVPQSPDLPAAVDMQDLAERAVASVSARRSVWTVWNVRAEVERLLRSDVPALPPERHREIADRVTALAISPAHSIFIEAPAPLDEPAELRRADGESVFTEHASGRYTSQAVLDAETRLANAARTSTATGLSGPSVAAALDGFEARSGTQLDAGQRHLVTAFASDSRLLLAGIGPAGAGKTTAMRALSHVLRQGGRNLIPLATSAAAADVLGRELAVRAENLHKFHYEWTAGPFAAKLRAGIGVPEQARMFRLGPGDVVLVDEAGMAGTFLLDHLVQLASARGAVVRLLGDDRQLPAVEGGGALRLIAAQPGTPQLTTLYRFRDRGEAATTLRIRTGDPAAIDWYHQNGRICSGSRESMTQAAYDGWRTDMLAGKVTLMAAADGRDVTELAAQARADRVAAGQVEPDGVLLRDGNLAGAGDWIVTRLNDRRLGLFGGRDWVKNGDAWRVERQREDGSLTVRHLCHGGRVTLPTEYARDQVQLLYSTTAHRAQGATVDTAHPLITAGMSRESLYVLATRAREKTTLYVATHDLPFDQGDQVDRTRSDPSAYAAREILLNILVTHTAPLPATETITTAQEEAGSLATLVPRYLHAARQHADGRYRVAAIEALGEHDGRDLTADHAWDAVARRLFDAEADGWEPARLLATVAATRELASADNAAEVLAWRIDGLLADNQALPSADLATAPLLPWVPTPRGAPQNSDSAQLSVYIDEAARLINARVAALADTAIRHRPPWMSLLGQQPADPGRTREWLRHVGVIAAYRDQNKITDDDPRQILGPYAEPGHTGHKAYWHSAESVLTARGLAGLEPAITTVSTDDHARATLAADIYRALPEGERAVIATLIATAPGTIWLGDPAGPDERAVTQPAYAPWLVAELIRHGHLTNSAIMPAVRRAEPGSYPADTASARRGRSSPDIPVRRQGSAPTAQHAAVRPPRLDSPVSGHYPEPARSPRPGR